MQLISEFLHHYRINKLKQILFLIFKKNGSNILFPLSLPFANPHPTALLSHPFTDERIAKKENLE